MVNYKHLHYFWAVAREGGVARASERLHLTPQTISGQLSLLEEHLGVNLLNRVGRNLELTETGRLALHFFLQHSDALAFIMPQNNKSTDALQAVDNSEALSLS